MENVQKKRFETVIHRAPEKVWNDLVERIRESLSPTLQTSGLYETMANKHGWGKLHDKYGLEQPGEYHYEIIGVRSLSPRVEEWIMTFQFPDNSEYTQMTVWFEDKEYSSYLENIIKKFIQDLGSYPEDDHFEMMRQVEVAFRRDEEKVVDEKREEHKADESNQLKPYQRKAIYDWIIYKARFPHATQTQYCKMIKIGESTLRGWTKKAGKTGELGEIKREANDNLKDSDSLIKDFIEP